MKFEKLKKSKLSKAVADQVLKLIKNGSLKPNDKLPIETELASSLGVSRTAVREGMQRLLVMDIIEILPGQGTFVRKLPPSVLLKIQKTAIEDKKTLLEVIEFRKLIETSIVEFVADRITDKDLKKLKECIEKHRKGLTRNVFPAEGDMLFHKTLAMATHNKVLIALVDDLYLLVIKSVIGVKNYKKEFRKSLEDHEHIYNGLLKRDKNEAKEAMRKHLEWLYQVINKSAM